MASFRIDITDDTARQLCAFIADGLKRLAASGNQEQIFTIGMRMKRFAARLQRKVDRRAAKEVKAA